MTTTQLPLLSSFFVLRVISHVGRYANLPSNENPWPLGAWVGVATDTDWGPRNQPCSTLNLQAATFYTQRKDCEQAQTRLQEQYKHVKFDVVEFKPTTV